ncbi:hypothetical protein DU484_00050 (plasmid) [Haloplanus rubicundus]|uniref:Uncharacterized protein n=2 Tax=Haloplanus rubicundus TaxID=1547898 RepID=A0A345E849_9EURY|nr:hypothetical protein DU484_00050 [Haloplanus rubicundus]
MGVGITLSMSDREQKELFWLVVYAVVLALMVLPIFEMIVWGWNDQPWGLVREIHQGVINFGQPYLNRNVPLAVGISIYLGIALAMLVDTYKRVQGVLFWLALLFGSTEVLIEQTGLVDRFVELATSASWGLVLVAPLVLVGMFVAGVRSDHLESLVSKVKSQFFDEPDERAGSGGDDGPIEINHSVGPRIQIPAPRLEWITVGDRRLILDIPVPGVRWITISPVRVNPPRMLFVVTLLIIGYSAVEALVAYHPWLLRAPNGLTWRAAGFEFERLIFHNTALRGIPASAVFLFALYKFTSYESTRNVIQIGPARSGKTAEFAGLHITLEDTHELDPAESEGISVPRGRILDGKFPPSTGNEEITFIEIEYMVGELLREKVTLQTVDYGGALLGEVLAEVREDSETDLVTEATNWRDAERELKETTEILADDDASLDLDEGYDVSDKIAGAIWDCVRHADRIVLTVPLDDFFGPILAKGNPPEYLDSRVVSADASEDEIRNVLDIGENEQIKSHWMIDHEGERWYYKKERRDVPQDYLTWYEQLQGDDQFASTDFLLSITKADYAVEGFKNKNGTTAWSNYPQFRNYVVTDVLAEATGHFDTENSGFYGTADFWPVWYKVEERPEIEYEEEHETEDDEDEEDDDLRIDLSDDNIPALRGSKKLLERLQR